TIYFSGDIVLINVFIKSTVAACDAGLPSHEIKLEWGKGLAKNQKAEVELMELELEKDRHLHGQ
ncbi:hypothetical protein CSA_004762, partial [Cucumis sativus]